MYKLAHFFAAILLLSSCSQKQSLAETEKRGFTTENILAVRQGMSQDEIVEMFGPPDSVSLTTCGQESTSGAWACTIWKYGQYGERGRFYFSETGYDGGWYLNNFDIDRE